jgi:hypothetical protein
MIDHDSVPLVTTDIVMKVELVSPLRRQPKLPGVELGFIDGFDILPDVKSTIFDAGLFGAMANEGVVQPGTASGQSLGCAETKKPKKRNNGTRNFIMLLFTTLKRIGFYDIYTMPPNLNTSYIV